MDIKIVKDEMRRLDKITGLDTSKFPLRVSSRMTKTWGKVCYGSVRKKIFIKEIVFAERLLRYATLEHILEVVRHKYAHVYITLKFNKQCGHGSQWKRAALWLGCNGQRCNHFQEVDEAQNPYKYAVTCDGCGSVFRYRRKSNIVKELEQRPNSERFFCRRCGSHKFSLAAVSKV